MLKIWVLKAIVQKAISYLPASQKMNYIFQKYVTKGLVLSDELFTDKLRHFHQHWAAFEKFSTRYGTPFRAFELGTGWFPIVPILLFIEGAEKVFTWDVQALIREQNLKTTIGKFLENYEKGHIPIPEQKLQVLQYCYEEVDRSSVEEVLPLMKIKPVVGDARSSMLEDQSIDLILSNNTFEHIEESVLRQILREFKRIARPGGIMSHFIDLTDHFSHLDKSISKFNFLKFSPGTWQWIDNDVQPQNRLRITDYRKIYEEEGVPIEEEQNERGSREELFTIEPHQYYQTISTEDLLVSHSYLVSRM